MDLTAEGVEDFLDRDDVNIYFDTTEDTDAVPIIRGYTSGFDNINITLDPSQFPQDAYDPDDTFNQESLPFDPVVVGEDTEIRYNDQVLAIVEGFQHTGEFGESVAATVDVRLDEAFGTGENILPWEQPAT